ncbi:MBL fold metallo-hydrolase [Deinococcus yavapaiensis]|uniref:Glyoxylase-like metal-dependent hydrolase (Beta-lactamase superfamily II) n=1 Tax=Deinococcus yavapaiensis KR-236 TaxID=694435 RepID=A0A318SAK0_9DEIO|nr:MBL fold metallo-hydrolase [Deinococcus yavapaiensis]PYE56440.1 glyoxylase-like metal-dependent hydrolase (beta-lactamase superfamily II) [Deinococcus yavapaiensis KR-236]
MLTKVLDSLYALDVPIPYPMRTVTVLIDTASPVTMIDSALHTPDAIEAIESGLAELGLHWPDVERLIVTHHHPDHYGLAGLVEERSGAVVQMLDLDISRGARYWAMWESWLPGHVKHFVDHGTTPDVLETLESDSRTSRARVLPATRLAPLREGETGRLANRDWTVLWLPGHADGHLGLWNADEDLLIAGDAILPRISPNVGLYGYSRPDPLGDYFETLAKIRALNPARAVVGHHGPLMTGVAERAAQLTAHHEERLDLVRRELAERPRTAFDLSFAMFTRELGAGGRRFALAETLAHVEYLRLRGELAREWQGGAWVYRS